MDNKITNKWVHNPFLSIKEYPEIFLSFFEDYKDTIDVMDNMIKIGRFNKGKNSKSKVVPIINICYNFWKDKCLDKGLTEKERIVNVKLGKRKVYYQGYRSNLNLFYKEFEKINSTKIPKHTKNFIDLCFEISELRILLIQLAKEQDIYMAFENIVKAITFFIMEETYKFKEKSPKNMFKRERFVYMLVLPQMKERIKSYLFNKSTNKNKIKEDIIKKLEEIYKEFREEEKRIKEEFEKQNHSNPTESPSGFFRCSGNQILSAWDFFRVQKEEEFIYIFHECDSENSDILISLLKFFSDKLAQRYITERLKENLNKQKEEIMEELTKTHGSKYVLDKVREDELVPFRIFCSMYFIKKRMINRDDAKELIKKLREVNREQFERLKKLYVESKIKNLMAKDENLKYCIEKLEPEEAHLRVRGKGKMKKPNEEMVKKRVEDDLLYPSTKEKYIGRWTGLLKDISTSDIIADLKKI